MVRSMIAAGAAMMALGFAGSAQAVELVDNGSFEAPPIGPNPGYEQIDAPNDTAIDGWSVDAGSVDIVVSPPYGPAADGLQYLDLVGGGLTGSLSQVLATVVGQTYRLTFSYSHNLYGGLASAAATFNIAGLTDTVVHSTGTPTNLDWRTYTGTFVATDTQSKLSFTNTVSGFNAGVFLDKVSVAAAAGVPEPATWGMMILGFGVVGGALRSRRRTTVAVNFA